MEKGSRIEKRNSVGAKTEEEDALSLVLEGQDQAYRNEILRRTA